MRRALVFATVAGAAMSARADAPAPHFLRDHTETRGFMLGRPVSPRPTPDGKSVIFLRSPPRSPELALYRFDVASGKTEELLTPAQLLKGAEEQLSPEERARRERMRVTLRGFTAFDMADDGGFLLVKLSGRLYVVPLNGKPPSELPTGAAPVEDPRLSPDGKKVAFVRDRDLYVLDLATKKETRLTTSTDPRITNGLAEFVAQEEMGRFTGYWWSPDGRSIAFEESDTRGVETFHLGDAVKPEVAPASLPYPRPGKANALVRLGVVGLAGGKPTWIRWDREKFPYLATVVWNEGATLTLAVQSRDQHDLELHAADAKTGKTRELLSEHDDAWLNLDQTVPRWLPDGKSFLWSSERDGRARLELRDATGKLVRPLSGDESYAGLIHVDPKRRQAWYHAAPDPTEQHLFVADLDGGAARRATVEAGQHVAVFGKGHDVHVQTLHTLESMPRTVVVSHEGEPHLVGELPSVAEKPPFTPSVELDRAGKDDFRALLVRPRNFDRKKKYPILLDVYGGPRHLHVARAQAPMLLRQWLADHGYIVVSVDGRGTPHRGRAWERAIAGDFSNTIDDQVAALDALAAKHPELDLTRVGVTGWSFGGYLSALAVLARPDKFKVAVSGAPVVDWRDYDTHYTERYLGLPDANKAGYDKSSLLTWAPKLSRPLLLIHGTADDNVYFLHTLKLAEALFRAGKPFELLPLWGLTHMVPDPLVKERLYERIVAALAAALHP
jgi:dipeptidyl-peptidase-4